MPSRTTLPRRFYYPPRDSDGGDDGDDGGDGRTYVTEEEMDRRLERQTQQLMQNAGGAHPAVATLLQENNSLRQQRRELRQQVPGENAIVLEGDDAEAWNAYREAGDPDEVTQKMAGYDEMKAAQDRRERGKRYEEAAGIAGLSNAAAFRDVAQDKGLNVSVEVRGEGDDAKKQAYVTVEDGTDEDGEAKTKQVPLTTYVDQDLSHLKGAFTADPSGSNGQSGDGDGGSGGGTLPAQSKSSDGDGDQKESAAARRRQRRRKRNKRRQERREEA